MIDLHMHTTASDGRLSPVDLVARAAAAGLTTISVTDHDTIAALAEVTAAAAQKRIRVVPGIELTAIDQGRDVHMLGYFFDPASAPLAALLHSQRALRVLRVREIAAALASLNMPIDVEGVLLAAAARPGSSCRPAAGRARAGARRSRAVGAGRIRSMAGDRDVPPSCRGRGRAPAAVIESIHGAGGVASFAHPGVTRRDELIGPLVEQGLDAIEVYHSDHTAEDVVAYRGLAMRLGALVSGGSDFHGDDSPFAKATGDKPRRAQRSTLGAITLPAEDLAALEQKAVRLRPASARLRRRTGAQAMTTLLEIRGLVKNYQALRPLRIRELVGDAGHDRVAWRPRRDRGRNLRSPRHRRGAAGRGRRDHARQEHQGHHRRRCLAEVARCRRHGHRARHPHRSVLRAAEHRDVVHARGRSDRSARGARGRRAGARCRHRPGAF